MAKKDEIVEQYAAALQAEHEKSLLHAYVNDGPPIATLDELNVRVDIMRRAVEGGALVSEAAAHLGVLVMTFFTVGGSEVEDPQGAFDFGAEQDGPEPEPAPPPPDDDDEEDEEPEEEEEVAAEPPKRKRGRPRKNPEEKAEPKRRGRPRKGPLSVVGD